ncbi:N utilization substance protein B [Betaproteobacteria bacterium]|nr:N utilization substance protein B [Betaproteobacteria bacterium]GHU39952.1 N utilization substance protein B [Betaproteobacteria bacterium]
MNDTASPKPAKRKSGKIASERRKARELALQGLYQWRIGGADAAAVESHMPEWAVYAAGGEPADATDAAEVEALAAAAVEQVDGELYLTLVRGVIREHETLTAQLTEALDRPFDELSPIEAAILLLATFEFAHCPATPYRVIINEAIELAKQFGSNEGHRYVNGVLDKTAARLRGAEVAARNA